MNKLHMSNETIQFPQGMKWTRQRKDVYEVLYYAHEPLNALQIYHCIMKKIAQKQSQNEGGADKDTGSYAVSTIYRILTAFEEKGLVTRNNGLDSGSAEYELNRGQHTHYAVCLACHKHIPLHACPFEHMHLPEAEGDFQITGHKLELYGYCKDCIAGV